MSTPLSKFEIAKQFSRKSACALHKDNQQALQLNGNLAHILVRICLDHFNIHGSIE